MTDASALDWPLVRFLIDGLPMLAGTMLSDWFGFDPGDMLDDDLPLVPDSPWRRVAVYANHDDPRVSDPRDRGRTAEPHAANLRRLLGDQMASATPRHGHDKRRAIDVRG